MIYCYFRSRTAFERAKTDVFRIRTHNIGALKKIRYVILRMKYMYVFEGKYCLVLALVGSLCFVVPEAYIQ